MPNRLAVATGCSVSLPCLDQPHLVLEELSSTRHLRFDVWKHITDLLTSDGHCYLVRDCLQFGFLHDLLYSSSEYGLEGVSSVGVSLVVVFLTKECHSWGCSCIIYNKGYVISRHLHLIVPVSPVILHAGFSDRIIFHYSRSVYPQDCYHDNWRI